MTSEFYPEYTQGKLDPQVEAFLHNIVKANLPPMSKVTPRQARAGMKMKKPMGTPVPVAKVENLKVPGPAQDIPIRIYTPEGKAPFPILVYFHAGGFTVGDLDMCDNLCRSFANGASCVVVSVEYRLAPENKHPAAVEDAFAAIKWVAENADKIQGDSSRIAVCGNSAGANLSAVVSLLSRDQGGPSIVKQVLICPALDMSSKNTDSFRFFGEGPWLSKADTEWVVGHYLKDEAQALSPFVSPLLADDLKGLPPALVITGEFDVFRDEGEAYANRLKDAGVPVICSRYNGMVHDFMGIGLDLFDRARDAVAEVASELRKVFKV